MCFIVEPQSEVVGEVLDLVFFLSTRKSSSSYETSFYAFRDKMAAGLEDIAEELTTGMMVLVVMMMMMMMMIMMIMLMIMMTTIKTTMMTTSNAHVNGSALP